jgi:hypothetical protein
MKKSPTLGRAKRAGSTRTVGEVFTSRASAGELGRAKRAGRARCAPYTVAWDWGSMYPRLAEN